MEFYVGQPNSSSLELEPSQNGNTINSDFSNPIDFLDAAMQPVEVVEGESLRALPPERDPQSVVARQRRERISHKLWVLGRMVPGGTTMDTASMLDEASRFLKRQVELLQQGQV